MPACLIPVSGPICFAAPLFIEIPNRMMMPLMRRNKYVPHFLSMLTLKQRIVLIFSASTLIPFLCTALISYSTMSSILSSKLEESVDSNLKQVQLSMESTIRNLNHVSQQIALPSNIGNNLDAFLVATQPLDRAQLYGKIKTLLTLTTFTNSSIGLTMYYFRNDGSYLFENTAVREQFSLERLPLLAEYFKISYYGPHQSIERTNDKVVISALRKMDMIGRDDVYAYVESDFNLTKNIIDNQIWSNHLFLDNNDRITYSEVKDLFPEGEYFHSAMNRGASGFLHGYYWFKVKSDQGWSIVSLIPKSEYNKDRDRWVVQMIFLFLLFIAVGLLIAWLLWKMLYKPLDQFNQEIGRITRSNFHPKPVQSNIPEFNFLLLQFQKMKEQIADLFVEIERKEKKRADLEIEKLLYQINPHFLMNTLDTVHWLAVMNGQTEIDRLVSSLNKLLHYNLGKLGESTTVQEEVESLKQYLTLQQIRYDFDFDVRIQEDVKVQAEPVPRFILQPLVENALYHGLNDQGYIQVVVKQEGETIHIAIHDNGSGIKAEDIQKLLNPNQGEHKKIGMGIGMNYVQRTLEARYGSRAKLEIESVMGKGTSIYLTLPISEGEYRHAEGAGGG